MGFNNYNILNFDYNNLTLEIIPIIRFLSLLHGILYQSLNFLWISAKIEPCNLSILRPFMETILQSNS